MSSTRPPISAFVDESKRLMFQREYAEAVKVCRLGLLSQPTHLEGRMILAMALLAVGRYEEALAELRVAREIAPKYPMVYMLQGEACAQKGDYKGARNALVKALEIDPHNVKAKALLEQVEQFLYDADSVVSQKFKSATKLYPARAFPFVDDDGTNPYTLLTDIGDYTDPSGASWIEPTQHDQTSESTAPSLTPLTEPGLPVVARAKQDPDEHRRVLDPIEQDLPDLRHDDDRQSTQTSDDHATFVEPDIDRVLIDRDERDDRAERKPPPSSLDSIDRTAPHEPISAFDETALVPSEKLPQPEPSSKVLPSLPYPQELLESARQLKIVHYPKRDDAPAKHEAVAKPSSPKMPPIELPKKKRQDVIAGDDLPTKVAKATAQSIDAETRVFFKEGEPIKSTVAPSEPKRAEPSLETASHENATIRASRVEHSRAEAKPSRGLVESAVPPVITEPLRESQIEFVEEPVPMSERAETRVHFKEEAPPSPKAGSVPAISQAPLFLPTVAPIVETPKASAPNKSAAPRNTAAPRRELSPKATTAPRRDHHAQNRARPPVKPQREQSQVSRRGAAATIEGDGLLAQMTGYDVKEQHAPRSATRSLRNYGERARTGFWTFILDRSGRIKAWHLVFIAVGVVVLAITIGLLVRRFIFDREIEKDYAEIAALVRQGNVRDYWAVSNKLRSILSRRPADMETQYWVQWVEHALQFEFGEPLAATSLSLPLEQQHEPSSRSVKGYSAYVYAALMRRDVEAALGMAQQFLTRHPQEGWAHYLYGKVQYTRGAIDEALSAFRRAIATDDKQARWISALGWAYLANNDHAQALKEFAIALKLNPDLASSLIGLTQSYLRQRQLRPAEEVLRSVVEREQRIAPSRLERAWLALTQAQLATHAQAQAMALEKVTTAIDDQLPLIDPLFLETLTMLYFDREDVTSVETVLNVWGKFGAASSRWIVARAYMMWMKGDSREIAEVLSGGAASPHAHFFEVVTKFERGDYVGVEGLLQKQRRSNDPLLDTTWIRVKLLLIQRRFSEAVKLANAWQESRTRNVLVLTTLGEVELAQGNLERAVAYFDTALTLNPKAASPRLGRAYAFLLMQAYKECDVMIAKLATDYPRLPRVQLRLAELDYERADFTSAEKRIKLLESDVADSTEIVLFRIKLLTAQRRYGEAEALMSRVRDASQAVVSLAQGRIELGRGNGQAAVAALSSAIRADGNHWEARQSIVSAHLLANDIANAATAAQAFKQANWPPAYYMAQAQIALVEGKARDAARMLAEALRSLKQHPLTPKQFSELNVYLGRAYYDLGQLDSARTSYDAARVACPLCADPYYRLALIADEKGEQTKAIELLHRAKTLEPERADLYYELGKIYETVADVGRAVESYQKFLSFNPPKELADDARAALDNLR